MRRPLRPITVAWLLIACGATPPGTSTPVSDQHATPAEVSPGVQQETDTPTPIATEQTGAPTVETTPAPVAESAPSGHHHHLPRPDAAPPAYPLTFRPPGAPRVPNRGLRPVPTDESVPVDLATLTPLATDNLPGNNAEVIHVQWYQRGRRGTPDRVAFLLLATPEQPLWEREMRAQGTLRRELRRARRAQRECEDTCEDQECNSCGLDVPSGVVPVLARISVPRNGPPVRDAVIRLGITGGGAGIIEVQQMLLRDVDQDGQRELLVDFWISGQGSCVSDPTMRQLDIRDPDQLSLQAGFFLGVVGMGGEGYDHASIYQFRDHDGDGHADFFQRSAEFVGIRCQLDDRGWPEGSRVNNDWWSDWEREGCEYRVERHVSLYLPDEDDYGDATPIE